VPPAPCCEWWELPQSQKQHEERLVLQRSASPLFLPLYFLRKQSDSPVILIVKRKKGEKNPGGSAWILRGKNAGSIFTWFGGSGLVCP